MKKVLSMVLAMATVASMASVGFAATPSDTELAGMMTITAHDDYYYDDDGDVMLAVGDSLDNAERQPGETVYIPIYIELTSGTFTPVGSDYKDAVKKLKTYTDWTVGKTDKVEIVYKKIANDDANVTTNSMAKNGYYYFVAVTIPENSAVKTVDLNGSIGVGKSSSDAKDSTATRAVNVAISYKKHADGADFGGGDTLDKKAPVVDFGDGEDECEIIFDEQELAIFTVNTTGQGDLNLKYSTKFDSEFAAKFSYANIDFLSFTKKPVFNRTGEMKIYAEEDLYLYEIVNGEPKEVKGAKYDEDEGAFIFKTRTLGSYAISDKELKVTESSSSEESSAPVEEESSAPSASTGAPTESGKPNPDTGR